MLGIGISGLMAFQRALNTTGHNISNANTEGYSRQRVELVTRTPQYAANGYIGSGVQVDTVRRMYDEFLTLQLRAGTAAHGQLESYYGFSGQIDNMLADARTGLAPALDAFFGATHALANDPTSIPARQVLLAEAGGLADRFHYLDRRLADVENGVNAQIKITVSEINDLASAIAGVNRQIVLAPGQGSDPPPNDLLDQRDQLIRRLAERVTVTTVAQDDGALNVFIGNGQTLVLGGAAQSLAAVANPYEATRYEVGYSSGAGSVNISSQLGGGTLGGLLAFRGEILDATRNALGRVAIGLAATFNAQHALGQDLNGALGGNFFSAIGASSPIARASTSNTGGAAVTVTVSNAAVLTASDYLLQYAGGVYTVTRLSDNTAVYSGAAFPATIASEGLSLALAGAPAAGDRFLIQPTRLAAQDFAAAISDPSKIAAAAPIRTREATDAAGLPTNLGTGKISAGSVSNTTNLPLAGNITLTFNSALNQFTVVGGPGGTLAYNPATEGGGKQFTFAGYGGITFTLSGTPANGDSFVIGNNTSGVGDNRNALELAGLQTELTLGGGTASYGDVYGQLVADVGGRTHSADINRNAQKVLLDQSIAARETVSGVNLDEEAAALVHFQQAYQAAAQAISIAASAFETLLAAIRN